MLESAQIHRTDALIVGSGPAGLMAADILSSAGARVLLTDAKPSFGRKFLMAGKSGLNLTKDQALDAFLANYGDATWLNPVLREFGPEMVKDWARQLGQDIFTGSSGRVFPRAMKASPLLRAWLGRLARKSVDFRTKWRWQGWNDDASVFGTADGQQRVAAHATVLALGGASWARLGSDGKWAGILASKGVPIAPFRASNMGFDVDWSQHMARFNGAPVKPVAVMFGKQTQRGEFVVTGTGVEGGVIYTVAHSATPLGESTTLSLDLLPDVSLDVVMRKLALPRGKSSLSNHLRKSVGLTGVKAALFHELSDAREPVAMARALKALPLKLVRPRPIDEAISTAGGIKAEALDSDLMLRDFPGVFCAGEMLDWDAPTGGYLLTACLATGRHAGLAAASYLQGHKVLDQFRR